VNFVMHQAKGMAPKVDPKDGPDRGKYRMLFREQFSKDSGHTTLTVFMDVDQLRSAYARMGQLLEEGTQ